MNELCPCCGGQEAVPGLFERSPSGELPLSLPENSNPGLLEKAWGRFFVRAEMPLPLHRPDTPLLPSVWLEVSEDAAAAIESVAEGKRRSYSGRASLASDIPGFFGTAGAACRIRFRSSRKFPEVIDCADQRIVSVPEDLDHEGMAALYRALWGNQEDVAPAHKSLRRSLHKSLRGISSAKPYKRAVVPPPHIAGIDPAEVVVVPPLDTGEPARMYTVGCSDIEDGEGNRYEIAAFLQNPSEDLVRCFGEFAYLSRMNTRSSLPGQIVPEKDPIPDSDGRMIAWILLYPWDEGDVPQGLGAEYICAVPLLAAEVAFAATQGPGRLADELRASGEDLTWMGRGSCVPEMFG